MISLENRLENAFNDLNISLKNRESIKNNLELIKQKDKDTYEHSVRVGILASKIGRYMHLDSRALMFAGALHDLGKIMIPDEILKRKDRFTKQDMTTMKKHSEYTYELLREIHPFSAEIALRHHRYQSKGYPEKLPKQKNNYSSNTKLVIDFLGRILSLVDFYDAITTRNNEKYGKKKLSRQEAKSILIENNQDQKQLIEDFYSNDIFK